MKAIPFESYEVFRSLCSSQAPAFDVDLCSIVVNATRYSLGRRTYMPSVVSDFIKRHISQLDDETLNRVISIVREYLNGEPQDPEISVWYQCGIAFCTRCPDGFSRKAQGVIQP